MVCFAQNLALLDGEHRAAGMNAAGGLGVHKHFKAPL